MLSKSKTFSHSHSHSHRRYLQIDRRVRDQERKTHKNGHFIGSKYTENIFWSRYAKWGAKYWFLFSLSHSEFPFSRHLLKCFRLRQREHVHSKLNRENGFFAVFTFPNTHSHLWKEFLVAATNIANATTMKQIYERDGMCAVMNQCPEGLGFGVWLVGVIVVLSRFVLPFL